MIDIPSKSRDEVVDTKEMINASYMRVKILQRYYYGHAQKCKMQKYIRVRSAMS